MKQSLSAGAELFVASTALPASAYLAYCFSLQTNRAAGHIICVFGGFFLYLFFSIILFVSLFNF
jgi:hypothetical protein